MRPWLLVIVISLLMTGCAAPPSPDATTEPAPGSTSEPGPDATGEPCPGCGTRPIPEYGAEPWTRTGARRPAGDAESLLMYYEYVRKLPAAERVKDYETARQRFIKSRSEFNRVRYAIALSVPGTSFNDDARALDTLEPLLRNQHAVLHSLAYMVGAQIQEQRRGQDLQQKLEALKSLEKSLIERDPLGQNGDE